jgi:hypothetical protein
MKSETIPPLNPWNDIDAFCQEWDLPYFDPLPEDPLDNLYYQSRRGLSRERFRALFEAAWQADRLGTLRLLARIRRVKGERQLGRWGLEWLAEHSPRDLEHNLRHFVTAFGRWDDLVGLVGCEQVAGTVLTLVATQLETDLAALEGGRAVSLCAKWVPSEGKRGDQQHGFNRRLAEHMGLTRKELRTRLTRLRREINLLETQLCEKRIGEVDYSSVPLAAMNRHGQPDNAFQRHDGERFAAWQRERPAKLEATVSEGDLMTALSGPKYRVLELAPAGILTEEVLSEWCLLGGNLGIAEGNPQTPSSGGT